MKSCVSVRHCPLFPLTAVPVLLPYKPHGSEELFYIPQREAGFLSDTTVESSHPGTTTFNFQQQQLFLNIIYFFFFILSGIFSAQEPERDMFLFFFGFFFLN